MEGDDDRKQQPTVGGLQPVAALPEHRDWLVATIEHVEQRHDVELRWGQRRGALSLVAGNARARSERSPRSIILWWRVHVCASAPVVASAVEPP